MTAVSGIIFVLVIIVYIFFKVNERRKNMELLRSVTDEHRGTWSECKLIINLLKHNIPAITIYHDLYVERHPGRYSQVDAVVVTKVE